MSENLSRRQQQIIQLLTNESEFVSTGKISKELNVSRRTILREIDTIEKWLLENDVILERKTSKGIKLILDDSSKSILIENMSQETIEMIYTPEERQKKLIIDLLNATEPRKIYYYASMMKVSEATISYDLDKIEELLASWQLKLIRKPGYGVLIEGRESNFRKAIIQVFNEYFNKGELLDLIRDDYIKSEELFKKTTIKKALLDIIGYTMLETVEEAVKKSGAMKTHSLADSAYAALIIHLSLAVKRLSEGDIIRFDKQYLEELIDTSEYEVATLIIEKTSQLFDIDIPKDEIGYVALHLRGAKLKRNYNNSQNIRVHDYEIIYLVELLVKEMETLTGYILVEDQQLFSGLVNHFGPAVARIKQNMVFDNPLLSEMKEKYSKYYDWVNAAVKVVEAHIGLKIPESEIGYLTMHFAASVESIKKVVQSPWKIIIACSTGIGSSKLLEARVKKYYKNLEIIAVMSTLDVENLESDSSCDLIISTVALKIKKVPSVVVSPMLLEDDIRRIEIILNGLTPIRQVDPINEKSLNLVVKLDQLVVLSNASKDILNNFFILNCDGTSIDKMSLVASQYIGANVKTLEIQSELLERETKGSTVFDGTIGRLLHCRSAHVDCIYFGIVLTPEKEYSAVMVAPQKLDVIERNLLGQISMNLMDNEEFKNSIKKGALNDSYRELEMIIHNYIKNLLEA